MYSTCGDTKASGVVIDNGPDQRLPLDLGGQESIKGDQRGHSETNNVLVIEVLPDVEDIDLLGEEWR